MLIKSPQLQCDLIVQDMKYFNFFSVSCTVKNIQLLSDIKRFSCTLVYGCKCFSGSILKVH